MRDTNLLLLLAGICTCCVTVRCDFMLFVNLVNYTNPTGLCAECLRPLNTSNPEGTIPVCCDEQPYKPGNCTNTGGASCDTRFRWTTRTFGATLETRPTSGYAGFTDCTLSPSTCPFNEMSQIFSQGPRGILNVTDNPLIVTSAHLWTGQIQFFIEPIDSGLPYIIDSLLVNLDSLQLGGDFTEEMMFTGFHDIATMTMSFKMQCSPGFCGRHCKTTPTNNPLVVECHTDGSLTCIDSRRDPLAIPPCTDCLYSLGITTNCSACLEANYDPDTNCSTCLEANYDPDTNCSTCLETNYDPDTNCQTCLSNYDTSTNCSACLRANYDPDANCSACLRANYDPDTNCQTCLSNYDTNTNCLSCTDRRYDPAINCELCIESNLSTLNECIGITSAELSMSTVGGIIGGVVGVQLIVILIMLAAIVLVVCNRRRGGNKNTKFTSDTGEETERFPVSTTDNETIQLQPNPLYAVHTHQHPTAASCEPVHTHQHPTAASCEPVHTHQHPTPASCEPVHTHQHPTAASCEPVHTHQHPTAASCEPVHTHQHPTAASYEPEQTITMEQNPVYQVTNARSESVQLQSSVEEEAGRSTDIDLADYYENTELGPTTKSAQQEEYDYIQIGTH